MATAHTIVVPGVGVKWQVRDGADVLYESEGGFADATEAAAAGAATLGTEWPGSETDGTWHYVGEAGEPAFQNSWDNFDVGKYQLAYRVIREGEVDVHGQIIGGADGSIVTTLADLAPTQTDFINAYAYDAGGNIQRVDCAIADTSGELAVGWSPGFTPTIVTIHGHYYLDPPSGP